MLKALGQYNLPAEGMRSLPDGNFEYKFDGKWSPISANEYKSVLRKIFTAKGGEPQIKKSTKTETPVKKKGELD